MSNAQEVPMRSFRPLAALLALVLVSPAGSVLAADRPGVTVKIRVDGPACPFCAYGLEKKLKRVEGVKDLEIDLEREQAAAPKATAARCRSIASKTSAF